MSYHFYKMAHVISIFFFLTLISISFYSPRPSRIRNILTGIATLFVFAGGMGLMARIGIQHGKMWPTWILGKVGVWLFIAIMGPVIAKRIPELKTVGYITMMLAASVAVYLAVAKPY